MTVDWRVALAAAREITRLPPTPEQQAWDDDFARWVGVALRVGRKSQEAIAIAYTRTEDQFGDRPAEETT